MDDSHGGGAGTASSLPPSELACYTHAYVEGTASPRAALTHSRAAWDRVLGARPLLHLTDRAPHGDYDGRALNNGASRRHRVWRQEELTRFGAIVEERTHTLLLRQRDALRHWHAAATTLQALARGHIARQRVTRMRRALLEAAFDVARARELAALRRRQHRAALRIQRAYCRHHEFLRLVFNSRVRVQRAVKLHLFRQSRRRAARLLQRVYRAYRRRVQLWAALGTVVRLLRLSRQREAVEAHSAAFQVARAAARTQAVERAWAAQPVPMAQMRRVLERKAVVADARTRLPLVSANVAIAHSAKKLQTTQQALTTAWPLRRESNQSRNQTSLPPLPQSPS